MYKPSPCQCTIQFLLKEQENILKIIYAEKNQTDNNSFIVYTIQTKVIYLKDFFLRYYVYNMVHYIRI
jgi:hypothetical protein